jgi:hypothetical protein
VNKEASIVIANAIIWGAVIVATASRLKGTDYFSDLLPILGGGAAASLLVVGMCAVKKKQG